MSPILPTDDDAPDEPLPPLVEPEREPDAAPSREARADRTRKAPREPRKTRRERADTRPARGGRVKTTTSLSDTVLRKGISESIQALAIAATLIDPVDGATIAQGEARLTDALMATARANPAFKARLEGMLQGGTYMQLAFAVGAIVLPITMRHLPMPPAFKAAAVMATSHAMSDGAPDHVPAEWEPFGPTADVLRAPDGTPLVPGVVYRDAEGAYVIDEHGNVQPFDEHADAN